MDNPALQAAANRGRTMASSSKLNDVYSDEEAELLKAMTAYKQLYHRPNPTCCEIMAVLVSLGWRKMPQE